jgi:hypothetical protein
MSTPSNLHRALAGDKAPLLTAEAFADLQRRALLKGLRLTRSEANGETRVWLNGREVLSLDDLEAIIVHARSPWDRPLAPAKATPAPSLTLRQLEERERVRQARMALGATALAGALRGALTGSRTGAHLLASIESMNAAETAVERAKRAP